MNLLIHDLRPAEWDRIADRYRDWTVVSDNGSIRPCIGCFHCWASESGVCAFRDGYENMGALIHEAEEVTVMSRFTYGGFSPFVKNVFDRSLGYVLPEFEVAYGEMHHKKRYPEDKPVSFLFRGSGLSAEEKAAAEEYVAAVCRNLRGSVKEVVFKECGPGEAAEPFSAEAAERSGILLIDCSPRGEKSNTKVFLERLRAELKAPEDMMSLASAAGQQQAAGAVSRAGTLVMGVPLYVDGLPSSVLRWMEKVKEQGAGRGCRFYAVVNSGLYESRQNRNLLNMLKAFCAENGFVYCGTLAIGAGEVAGLLMRGHRKGLWPARSGRSGLARLADAIASEREFGDSYEDPFLFPRRLYILIANTNWQNLKKREKSAGSGGR